MTFRSDGPEVGLECPLQNKGDISQKAMSYVHHCYHVIFSTKHRRPLIQKEFQEALYQYIGGIIRDKNGSLVEIGGLEDHIQLLAYFHQTIATSDMIRDIKSGSSRWLNEVHTPPEKFNWQVKYGSFSVSQSAIPKVKAYIQGQEKHHRKESFQDEFRRFLTQHGFEIDERYIWD